MRLCSKCVQVGGSSLKSMPSATRGLKSAGISSSTRSRRFLSLVRQQKLIAAPAFDAKAAGQLAVTFSIWYAFNAACKCSPWDFEPLNS